ncbi:MAG: hypothetical protein ABII27_04495 [bacterium]
MLAPPHSMELIRKKQVQSYQNAVRDFIRKQSQIYACAAAKNIYQLKILNLPNTTARLSNIQTNIRSLTPEKLLAKFMDYAQEKGGGNYKSLDPKNFDPGDFQDFIGNKFMVLDNIFELLKLHIENNDQDKIEDKFSKICNYYELISIVLANILGIEEFSTIFQSAEWLEEIQWYKAILSKTTNQTSEVKDYLKELQSKFTAADEEILGMDNEQLEEEFKRINEGYNVPDYSHKLSYEFDYQEFYDFCSNIGVGTVIMIFSGFYDKLLRGEQINLIYFNKITLNLPEYYRKGMILLCCFIGKDLVYPNKGVVGGIIKLPQPTKPAIEQIDNPSYYENSL